MQGELWIDTQTFHWAKVTAQVLHPVSIAGIVARVEPGTGVELERMPVGNGVWLAAHLAVWSRNSVLLLFRHERFDDQTYFNYRRISQDVEIGAPCDCCQPARSTDLTKPSG